MVSQFRDLEQDNAAAVKVIISGPGFAVAPSAIVQVASAAHALWYSTHSFQWMKRNIPAGTTATVTVQLGMTSRHRKTPENARWSIDVFNGLL